MSSPAILSQTTHYQGDRWVDGYRHFGPVSINSSPPSAPCLYAEMRIVKKGSGAVGHVFSSSKATGDGKITIVDSVNYEFEIGSAEESLPLSEGVWEWDFATYRTADGSDLPLTIWSGSINIKKRV